LVNIRATGIVRYYLSSSSLGSRFVKLVDKTNERPILYTCRIQYVAYHNKILQRGTDRKQLLRDFLRVFSGVSGGGVKLVDTPQALRPFLT
jgi:hypothetical protein